MKNIKLEKATGKGWFLDIEGLPPLALTTVEVWTIYKIIKDNMSEILPEMKEDIRKK